MIRSLARTHPDATGGRIFRPSDIEIARAAYRMHGAVILYPHDPVHDAEARAAIAKLARSSGITAKRLTPREIRALRAAEAVFGGEGADGAQRSSVVNGGGE